MSKKEKFYSIKPLFKRGKEVNALYFLSVGKRSNGKTFQSKETCLCGSEILGVKGFLETGKPSAYIRRWEKDFKGKNGKNFFDDIIQKGYLKKWSKNKYVNIIFKGMIWYAVSIETSINDDGKKVEKKIYTPCLYAVALTNMEHDKGGGNIPDLAFIFFDEFITRGIYLYDEYITFSHVISTLVRERGDIPIILMANTITWDCPYFKEMGITNVKKMKPGQIDVYTYVRKNKQGKELKPLNLVIEYIDSSEQVYESSIYFAFNNPKLNMITEGEWEIPNYPHSPYTIDLCDIRYTAFLKSEFNEYYVIKIVKKERLMPFLFIHPIDKIEDDKKLLYSNDNTPNILHERTLKEKGKTRISQTINSIWESGLVYYSDNTTGENINNYLNIFN